MISAPSCVRSHAHVRLHVRVRPCVLAQFKGDYAITDFVYRKYTQAVHGGWGIIHIEETDQGHHVTREQALVKVARVLERRNQPSS